MLIKLDPGYKIGDAFVVGDDELGVLDSDTGEIFVGKVGCHSRITFCEVCRTWQEVDELGNITGLDDAHAEHIEQGWWS